MATRFIEGVDPTSDSTISAIVQALSDATKGVFAFVFDLDTGLGHYWDRVNSALRTLVNTDQAQTLTNKTLTSPTLTSPTLTSPVINIAVAALAATGADQAGAAAIATGSFSFTHATAADGTKGIRLPAAAAGGVHIIKNSDAANAVLKVYPATGDAINALAANASLDMAAKTSAILVALDATTWYSIPLLPS